MVREDCVTGEFNVLCKGKLDKKAASQFSALLRTQDRSLLVTTNRDEIPAASRPIVSQW